MQFTFTVDFYRRFVDQGNSQRVTRVCKNGAANDDRIEVIVGCGEVQKRTSMYLLLRFICSPCVNLRASLLRYRQVFKVQIAMCRLFELSATLLASNNLVIPLAILGKELLLKFCDLTAVCGQYLCCFLFM